MQWFLNLSTRAKIVFGFGVMFLLLAIITITALVDVWTTKNSFRDVVDHSFRQVFDLTATRSNVNRTRAEMLEMIATQDRAKQQALEQDIKELSEEDDKNLKELNQLYKSDHKNLTKLDELNTTLDAYRKTRGEQIELIRAGKVDEARRLGVGIQDERYNKIRNTSLELGQAEMEHAQQQVIQAEQKAGSVMVIFLIIGTGALIFSVVVSGAMTKGIATPLTELTGVAERVAVGELDLSLPPTNRIDEVGILSQAFRRLVANVNDMASMTKQIAAGDLTVKVTAQSEKDVMGNALAAMVDNLRSQTLAIHEGVNVLAASSGEILSFTTQIASSAAETASAVNETTVTVEEVKQTTQLAAVKAREVSDNAQKSLQVSQHGRKAVGDAVQGMNRIREQMETIAESIMSLSDQSQAIGEIIATVNDLAEQSNLLAVNAAIEAAKAGEHGKGFAVVAQEVKSLAEQSKQATAQVRTILNDIQKATNAAVMATEQGSKAVEAGEKQSGEAGESIRLMADSVVESANASTQIAASSQQQMVGMDQVSLAMENIKEASNLSVTSTQQAEQSAQNLHELGQTLKRLVAQFKL